MWNKVPKNEYHKGKPGTKKNPYSKDKVVIDKKSELGYSDGSPYNNDPFIDINTPNGMIDMSNTGRALMANGRYLQPYSGLHQFDTNVVREQPIAQYGGDPSIEDLNQMKKGGWLDGYSKQTKLKGDRGFTSKNIKTSINDLMMRNEMLFGPSGKKRYKPGLKYKDGGGLDTYQLGSSTYTPLSKSDSLVTDKTLHTAAFDTTKYGYEIEKTKPNKDDNVWKIDLQTGKKIAVPPYTWQPNKLAYQAAANKYAISQNKPITTPVFYTDFQYQQNNQIPIPASLQNKKLGGWLDQYQKGGIHEPLYVQDPNDPRLKAYSDSLNLYNLNQASIHAQNAEETNLYKARANQVPSIHDQRSYTDEVLPYVNRAISTNEDLSRYENLHNTYPRIKPSEPYAWPDLAWFDDQSINKLIWHTSNAYKKPVQPYVLGKPPTQTTASNFNSLASSMVTLGKGKPHYVPQTVKTNYQKSTPQQTNPIPATTNIPQTTPQATPVVTPQATQQTTPQVVQPTPDYKFRKQETNFGQTYYWAKDAEGRWYQTGQIPQGTPDSEIEVVPWVNPMKKFGGPTNWLDQYQTGAQVPANSIFAPTPKLVTAPVTTTPTSNLVVGTKGPFIKSNGSDNVWDQVKQQWIAPQNSSGMTFLDKPQSTAPKSKIPTKVEEMAPINPSFNALTTKPVAESTGVVKPTVGSINQGMDAASMSKLAPFVEAERRRQEATAQVRYRNQQQRANGTAPGLYDENTQVTNYLHQQDKQKETEDRAAVMMGGLALAPLALGIAGIPAVSTALATGFAAKGLYSIPNTYRNWVAAADPNSETTWEDALGTTTENALDFMGSGEVFKIGKEALATSKESGLLSRAHELNPYAFKPNPESYYRVMPDAGAKDLINSGFVRPAQGSPTSYFNKGVPLDIRRARTFGTDTREAYHGYEGPYMVESNNPKAFDPWLQFPEPSLKFYQTKAPIPSSDIKLYKEHWLQGYKEVPKQLPGSPNVSSVDDVVKQPWQMQELPGLHLKSTMNEGAISKIIEPKTGLINIEQALGIIGKESGGAEKVAWIKKGLGDNLPLKMDYNQFKKTVQDQLIPLERQFSTARSNYGIDRLGYKSYTEQGARVLPYTNSQLPPHYKKMLDNIDSPNNYYKGYSDKFYIEGIHGEGFNSIDDAKSWIKTTISDSQKLIRETPLENQTLILGNKGKFGRGSDAHGNPDETLGHAHFLRDAETPDVLTVTQIQSDAFQGTNRTMPKSIGDAPKVEKSLQRMQEIQERNKSVLNKMKTEGVDEAGLPVQQYQIKQFEDIVTGQESQNLMKKAEIENFSQKSLLDKAHQERYIQELVDYAGKRGDINKIRVPTSETAAKVQGYKKFNLSYQEHPDFKDIHSKMIAAEESGDAVAHANSYLEYQAMRDANPKKYFNYPSEQQTILKKYADQPKTIKKLFGLDVRIVTDSKGNTWYEFDIPEKFKTGKGEIKAFKQGGQKSGWLDQYQFGASTAAVVATKQVKPAPVKSAPITAATPATSYSWSPSGSTQVVNPTHATTTYQDAPHQDIVAESNKAKAEKDRADASNANLLSGMQAEYGNIPGYLRYQATTKDNWAESSKPGGAYDQFGQYLPDMAMTAFPVGEILEPIIGPASKWLAESQLGKFTKGVNAGLDAAIDRSMVKIPKELPGSPNASSFLEKINLERQGVKTKSNVIKENIQDGNFKINSRSTPSKGLVNVNIESPTGSIQATRNPDGSYGLSFKDANPFNAGKSMLKLKDQLAGKTIHETKSFSTDSYANILKLKKKLPFEEAGFLPVNSSNKVNNFLDDLVTKNSEEWSASANFKSEKAAIEGSKRMDDYMLKLGETTKSKVVNNNGKFEVHVPNYKIKVPEVNTTFKQLPGSPNNLIPQTPLNNTLGAPLGTIKDLERMALVEKYGLKTEGDFPLYQRKLDTDLIKYNSEMGTNLNVRYPNPTQADMFTGSTDIPQFNQEMQNFNTLMQFGKRPLETQIIARPETQNLLGQSAFIESTGDYPMYLNMYGTSYEMVPGLNLKRTKPLTGYQMFQQIQPNKYGGSPRKSSKKLVNYNQKSKFVNSQNSNWLDQYPKL